MERGIDPLALYWFIEKDEWDEFVALNSLPERKRKNSDRPKGFIVKYRPARVDKVRELMISWAELHQLTQCTIMTDICRVSVHGHRGC